MEKIFLEDVDKINKLLNHGKYIEALPEIIKSIEYMAEGTTAIPYCSFYQFKTDECSGISFDIGFIINGKMWCSDVFVKNDRNYISDVFNQVVKQRKIIIRILKEESLKS